MKSFSWKNDKIMKGDAVNLHIKKLEPSNVKSFKFLLLLDKNTEGSGL